jgi:hypothetical protein
VRASIIYRWRDGQGVERRGHGWTQNVSEEGILVNSAICPKVGDLVDLTLRAPVLRSQAPGAPLRMEMNARVVRVVMEAPDGKNLGFAVRRRAFVSAPEENSQPSATWRCSGMTGLRTN